MTNPNNNKNFNDEALRINRTLKKENDALSLIIDEVEDYFLNVNTGFEEEIYTDDIPSSQKIQDMIDKVRSRDAM